MAYVLGQYNKNKNVADDSIFMTLITSGSPRRRKVASDSGVVGVADIFEDECIFLGDSTSFQNGQNYYFHGKIKRMTKNQTFYIKLVNYTPDTATDGNVEQYLKTINVAGGDPDEWVDLEFIFTPLVVFDTLLFELQRNESDYRQEVRFPIIIYEEISTINNLISARIGNGISLLKLGVQSHPGLLMCINGEEIRTCRTGVYELKNGIMTVTFFSVVAGAEENDASMYNTMADINTAWEAASQIEDAEARQAAIAAIGSRSFLASSKSRTIDSFTLDYMFREE